MSETYRNTQKTKTTTITTPSENFKISTSFNYKEYRATNVEMRRGSVGKVGDSFYIIDIKELKELAAALNEHIEDVEKGVL